MPILDAVEEHILTVLAGLSAVPATVLPTLAIEGRVATQHDVAATQQSVGIKSPFELVILLPYSRSLV